MVNEDRAQLLEKKKDNFYQGAITSTLAFWEHANTDALYEAGSQNAFVGAGNYWNNGHRNWNFNFIRPTIEMVAGRQKQNRKAISIIPRINGTQETADQATRVIAYQADVDNLYEKISKAFSGALISGLNLLHLTMDYTRDPINGEIKTDVLPYNAFVVDPNFTQLDFSDCQGALLRNYVPPERLITMFPDKMDIIEQAAGQAGTYSNARDMKFNYTPENFGVGLNNVIAYDQYYYRDYRNQKLVIDVNTLEQFEWTKSDELLDFVLKREPQLEVVKQVIPTVRLAIFIQDKCVYDGPTMCGDEYPLIPVIAYHHPEIPYYEWRVQSLVRGLRDTQFLYNRFIINIADVVESQVNSGWKYKKRALVNPDDIFLQGQGKGIELQANADMSDVEKIAPTEASASAFKLGEIFLSLRGIVSGVNDELLGSASDDVAGILSKLRQGAGLVTLQTLFDNLDYVQRILGRRYLAAIRINYSTDKVKRILDEEPTEWFRHREFGQYDTVVEEGVYTATQKQMQLAQLMEARKLLGEDIPAKTIIGSMTIQNKNELLKDIAERQQQAQQAQQSESQIQQQLTQAETQLAAARAASDQAHAYEYISRIAENQALADERAAESQQEQYRGVKDQADALKKLSEIDFDKVNQALRFFEALNQTNKKEEPQRGQGGPDFVNRGEL